MTSIQEGITLSNYQICDLMVLQVKELDDGVLELVKASDDCSNLSNAIRSIGNEYQPGPEVNVM